MLSLFHFLVKFGYYNSDDIKSLLRPVITLLNGKQDKPFPHDTEKGFSKEAMKRVNHFRNKERYEISNETAAVVNAKYQYVYHSCILKIQFYILVEYLHKIYIVLQGHGSFRSAADVSVQYKT